MIENNPPKGVSFSDLICIFTMSIVGFSCFFCNTKISENSDMAKSRATFLLLRYLKSLFYNSIAELRIKTMEFKSNYPHVFNEQTLKSAGSAGSSSGRLGSSAGSSANSSSTRSYFSGNGSGSFGSGSNSSSSQDFNR